jgi:hypothetical protein
MPTFLSDPPFSVYLVLAAVVLIAFAVWFANRSRRSLAVLAGACAVLAVVFVIDMLFESTREEAVRRAMAMVKAADARDTEAFVSHVADKFEYRGEGQPVTVTRDQLRKSQMWEVLKQYNVHVAAWDFARADVEHINDDTVEIGFLAKGEGQGQQVPIYLRAKFARQGDGQMKLTAIASFDPLKRVNERKTIPYFP